MHKCNARAADAYARLLIDQPHACCRQTSQGRVDVADSVGDVMQPGAALLQEARHPRFGTERSNQLDMAVADIEQHSFDTLIQNRLAMHERQPEDVAVKRERLLNISHRDTRVVDRGQQLGHLS